MKHTERKAQIKKDQILETAMKIVKKKGFNKVTMEEIAANLLMTKGSLYYYFENKSDLLFECHKMVLQETIERFKKILKSDQDVLKVLRGMVDAHIDSAIKEKVTFNLLISPKDYFSEEKLMEVVKIRNQYEEMFTKVINRGMEEGKFHCKDTGLARLFILGGMNWIQQWYNPNGRLSKEEIKDIYYHFILKILT